MPAGQSGLEGGGKSGECVWVHQLGDSDLHTCRSPQDTCWGWGGGAARKVGRIKRYLLWEAKLGPLSNKTGVGVRERKSLMRPTFPALATEQVIVKSGSERVNSGTWVGGRENKSLISGR